MESSAPLPLNHPSDLPTSPVLQAPCLLMEVSSCSIVSPVSYMLCIPSSQATTNVRTDQHNLYRPKNPTSTMIPPVQRPPKLAHPALELNRTQWRYSSFHLLGTFTPNNCSPASLGARLPLSRRC
ncbi:hypothetical protein O181_014019 [Austropuccinia psidii MF-1]|uniref:Uncharacterized protein n=1 Tax=Austropuccinia psidii MF-1 TaxID=1389203 RepID=A0A9Q3BZD1_9BASI|nr:hypothetical protein [Austropuccinia psidii MF-1]